MGVLEKIKTFFRRGKAATKAEPKPATPVTEKKTAETGGQEGTTKG